MATLKRLLKLRNQWRSCFTSLHTNNLTSSSSVAPPLPATPIHLRLCVKPVEGEAPPGVSSMLHPIIAGAFGVSMLQLAYADANEADARGNPTSEYDNVEKVVKQERNRIEELIKSKGMQYGTYPTYTIAIKGQKVTIKFHVPPTCELSHLIVHLASHLGLKAEARGSGADMRLRAWDSAVAWQLTLNQLEENGVQGKELSQDKDDHEGDLCVLIFQSLINSDNAEIEFIKKGSFSSEELEALVSTLKLAGSKTLARNTLDKKTRGYPERRENRAGSARVPAEQSIAALEAMGVIVYGLNEHYATSSNAEVSWDTIAGYDSQKREIEDTVLLALHSPEVYDDIARSTRRKFESNRPRAVLFEGPPGTGKTSCARVIANQAGVPLLYVPLEVVLSKYYGESERLLGKVFSLANELSDGAIIFLDEVDSFASARDEGMHEATRRILSVLLRQIDGFEQDKRVVVIAATNRTEDLDPALISRFDSMITFGLPDRQNREEITSQYAKHLTKSDLSELAAVTEGMSGRDIRDICQQAERRWASKIIRGQTRSDSEQGKAPPLEEYLESALNRQRALLGISNKKSQKVQDSKHHAERSAMDLA